MGVKGELSLKAFAFTWQSATLDIIIDKNLFLRFFCQKNPDKLKGNHSTIPHYGRDGGNRALPPLLCNFHIYCYPHPFPYCLNKQIRLVLMDLPLGFFSRFWRVFCIFKAYCKVLTTIQIIVSSAQCSRCNATTPLGFLLTLGAGNSGLLYPSGTQMKGSIPVIIGSIPEGEKKAHQ